MLAVALVLSSVAEASRAHGRGLTGRDELERHAHIFLGVFRVGHGGRFGAEIGSKAGSVVAGACKRQYVWRELMMGEGGELGSGFPRTLFRQDMLSLRASADSSAAYDDHRNPLSTPPVKSIADMQSTRFLGANMMRQQAATSMVRSRVAPMLRTQPTRGLRLQATPKMSMPVPVCHARDEKCDVAFADTLTEGGTLGSAAREHLPEMHLKTNYSPQHTRSPSACARSRRSPRS